METEKGSGEHAKHVLEIMLKASESAKTGQTQSLTTIFQKFYMIRRTGKLSPK